MRAPFELTEFLNCMAVHFLLFLYTALCEHSSHVDQWKCWSKSTLIVLLLERRRFFFNAMRYLPVASWENSALLHKTHARKNNKYIEKKNSGLLEGEYSSWPRGSQLYAQSVRQWGDLWKRKKKQKNTTSFFLLTDTARRASSASGTLKSLLNVHEVWGSSGAINTRSSRLCPRLCMDLIASNRGHTFGRGLWLKLYTLAGSSPVVFATPRKKNKRTEELAEQKKRSTLAQRVSFGKGERSEMGTLFYGPGSSEGMKLVSHLNYIVFWRSL